ncbi:MAG: outer membrane protein assembly factor BamD [Myxococcota bacterium]
MNAKIWIPAFAGMTKKIGVRIVLTAGPLLLGGLWGCASKQAKTGLSAQDARTGFAKAQRLLDKKRYSEAIEQFEQVKQQFPYTKYAALSDLRIADAHFMQKQWVEAMDAYELFLNFHPQHEQVPHAAFRMAKAAFLAMPKRFFLLPAPHRKDQAVTHKALAALDTFLAQYSDRALPARMQEARHMKQEVDDRLAKHALAVGDFYAKRKKWRGAAARYEQAAFADAPTSIATKGLLRSARIQLEKLQQPHRARLLLLRLLQLDPELAAADQARQLLARTRE